MKNPIKNPWTTITGTLLLIVSGLSLYGVLTREQLSVISDYIPIIIEAVAGIVAVFVAKDKGGGL